MAFSVTMRCPAVMVINIKDIAVINCYRTGSFVTVTLTTVSADRRKNKQIENVSTKRYDSSDYCSKVYNSSC